VDSETGLSNYRARYYDSSAGRFLSSDPITFGGGTNFYTYVRNQSTKLIDPSGLADVYIWAYTGSSGNWGHAGLMLNNGTYISWWPGEPRDAGLLSDVYTAPARAPSLAEDQTDEHTTPAIIHLDNLDENAIQSWWDRFRQNHKWKTLSQNCSTTLADALNAGGGRHRAPLAPQHLVWTPADVEEYARQIQKAGQGQYISIPPFTPFE